MKSLEFRNIDQEARSRRNNLLFWKIPEVPNENSEWLVQEVIYDDLEFGEDMEFVIQRVHRYGKKARGKTRPLIVCFRDYRDVEDIIGSAVKLKGSWKGISRDYPNELNEARRALWPKYKELRRKYGEGNVKFLFPAKISVNSTIVEDAFPNWRHIIATYDRKYNKNSASVEICSSFRYC